MFFFINCDRLWLCISFVRLPLFLMTMLAPFPWERVLFEKIIRKHLILIGITSPFLYDTLVSQSLPVAITQAHGCPWWSSERFATFLLPFVFFHHFIHVEYRQFRPEHHIIYLISCSEILLNSTPSTTLWVSVHVYV